MSNLLALIPAYNEQDHITAVVEQTRAHLPVLVVDDGSRDATADRAESAGATVIRQQPNQGKGAALRAGFQYALDAGCAAVVMLDADGQHAPDEIPRFLEAFAADPAPDLVIGARDYSQMPTVRRISNTIGRWAYSWALGQDVPDNQSGYRLLSRRMMESMLASDEHGFEFEVEMITRCVVQGCRLGWVPIRTIYAGETSHIQPVQHVIQFARIVWQTRQRVQQARRG
jgi:glycosyltransferase involved in cell wall biosynthesis